LPGFSRLAYPACMKRPPSARAIQAGHAVSHAAAAFGGSHSDAAELSADGHQALVLNSQRGDKKAFAALVEIYQQTVYGFLRARLIEPADAEDLTQEVFLRLYLGREKLSRARAIGSWLVGIARNVLREHVKKHHRRREVAWTELCLDLDDLVSPHHHVEHDALLHLPGCLESLGQSARQAIDLRYSASLKWSQVGERLKRSEGAVKLLVHRARQALKHCLDRKMKPLP
jgi:RNA polymerase sigma-70 factor (ECF subfamily)